MECNELLWTLIKVIAGFMLLCIIIVGQPDPWHYGVLVGDVISLVWDAILWFKNK